MKDKWSNFPPGWIILGKGITQKQLAYETLSIQQQLFFEQSSGLIMKILDDVMYHSEFYLDYTGR
jgi:hypothetical protein